jgi:hypothetical protein
MFRIWDNVNATLHLASRLVDRLVDRLTNQQIIQLRTTKGIFDADSKRTHSSKNWESAVIQAIVFWHVIFLHYNKVRGNNDVLNSYLYHVVSSLSLAINNKSLVMSNTHYCTIIASRVKITVEFSYKVYII